MRAWATRLTPPSAGDAMWMALALATAITGAALYAFSAYAVSPWALPALAIVGAFTVVVLWRPAWGLGATLAAVPLEAVTLPIGAGSLSPTEAGLALVGLGWLARFVVSSGSVAPPRAYDWPIAALLGAGAVGLFTAPEVGVVARVLLFWFLFTCAFMQARSLKPEEIRVVLKAFAAGAGVLGGIGALRYLQSGGGTGLLGGGTIASKRAVGTFGDANYFASMVALGVLPGLALLMEDARRNAWLALPLAAGTAGIALSLSRGGIAGFALGLIVLLAWRRARWLAVAAAALFTILTLANANPILRSEQYAVVSERLSTVGSRLGQTTSRPRIWSTAINIAEQHPFFGVGLNQFPHYAIRQNLFERGNVLENAHSIPFSLLAETGVLGLAAFLVFVGQLGVRAVRSIAAHARDAAIPLGLAAALAAFLAQGLTVVQIRVNALMGAFLVVAGLLTGYWETRVRSRT